MPDWCSSVLLSISYVFLRVVEFALPNPKLASWVLIPGAQLLKLQLLRSAGKGRGRHFGKLSQRSELPPLTRKVNGKVKFEVGKLKKSFF